MRISDWSSDVCSSDLMESALVIHLAAAFYPVAQIDIVEIGQPREADLFEHRQRSEAARLCLRIKEGIDRRERPRQMIDDGDSEQLFAVAKTPVAHIQQREFEEGVEGIGILWKIGRASCRERVGQHV